MTKSQAKKAIELLQAYIDGKPIEYKIRGIDKDWCQFEKNDNPAFDWGTTDYRIKPEPTYRPFASVEEAFNEAKKHGFWVDKGYGSYELITRIDQGDNSVLLTDMYYSFEVMLNFKWCDDKTPCGIK